MDRWVRRDRRREAEATGHVDDGALPQLHPERDDSFGVSVHLPNGWRRGTNRDGQLVYVKAADKLDAYLKCVTELAAGNREFAVAKRQIEEPLFASTIPEVRYFLERFTPSFEKTLDEITE